jgi:hypothetical protein|tara:strand:+ start:251 stop:394 length:144 start_codon:yes stop_codon:yes gene_type:complete
MYEDLRYLVDIYGKPISPRLQLVAIDEEQGKVPKPQTYNDSPGSFLV